MAVGQKYRNAIDAINNATHYNIKDHYGDKGHP
jgi:hypothetical protein